jgi:hypothetical protein
LETAEQDGPAGDRRDENRSAADPGERPVARPPSGEHGRAHQDKRRAGQERPVHRGSDGGGPGSPRAPLLALEGRSHVRGS